jgi:hypothetical protein
VTHVRGRPLWVTPKRRSGARVGTFTWSPPAFPSWKVNCTMESYGGELVIGSIEVASSEDERSPLGVTTDILRALPLAELLMAARSVLFDAPLRVAEWESTLGRRLPEQRRASASAAEGLAQPRGRGRPALEDDHYRSVAALYVKLQREGSTRVIEDLTVELERPRPTVRNWVRVARQRGFLTPGTRGRAGADLGPNF